LVKNRYTTQLLVKNRYTYTIPYTIPTDQTTVVLSTSAVPINSANSFLQNMVIPILFVVVSFQCAKIQLEQGNDRLLNNMLNLLRMLDITQGSRLGSEMAAAKHRPAVFS
jgi:hypothetical protein